MISLVSVLQIKNEMVQDNCMQGNAQLTILWGGDIVFVARYKVQLANLHIYIIKWQLWDVGNFHMIYIEDIIHDCMFYLRKMQCLRWDSIPGPLAL